MGKKTFNQTIEHLRYGTLHDELTDKLNDLNAAVAETGKVGEITLKIKLKPGSSGQVEVFDDVKVKMPEAVKGSTIMFLTPENNLQREDPRQRTLEGLRTVADEQRAIREVPTEPAKAVKTA